MPLVLNEEQNMLKDAAKDFCTNNTPITQLRKLRDEKDDNGFDSATWQQMVELGWAGITIPEDFGGLGFGHLGMGVVMEECGRTLAASPLFATAVLGSSAILHGGSDELKGDLLPQVAGGELLLALALEETPHHSPYGSSTKAKKSGDGYKVTGSKKFVLDGHVANKIVVVARSTGKSGNRNGLTLVLVDRDAEGVSVTRTIMADSRNAANIDFDGAKGVLLGEAGKGADVLDKVLDAGRILLSAEMLGGVQECFERTIEYLKIREQFGVPIGSFQALKHRAAQMFCEVELSKSVVLEGLSALDDDSEQVAELASLTKARLNDTYNLVSSEGVQMHGGIGMTDEYEIGFFLKRSRVCEHALGNSAFHRDRYGETQGY
ncbi:MAG TPA: acyl-CoA dehydrogenase family protein [Pseudomonadales bacterium]|jgi:acyl-CoA dehydrogenase|nr:acyl-CoA dehydrogenase [Gammaproteobacteria bacterium]MDP6027975.1 acyl-CoA dehydrogenase family protein [Pseudomonadales bacterium]MDP6317416.1 acyl-CoA dehydrogenase family protein [Pseudomonadales bacterium]MDP7313823.1 acyl-CoA dehydrogenase family protein [Pseudomonadales bacterium]HJL60665.1 acyl-CoA dehydrogenase family protein [Pseudomonadales bacterium]|tara:strand:- start:148 stop:1278 length:1131 start_codon:yes stop_codon:yes gene_type:complete